MSSQDRNKPLNIYRASAGSGKTHLLTGFYIKQLFLTDLLPESHSGDMNFSEILAVTFTNKATAEMKGRIIDELYLLSLSPKDSDYWDDVSLKGIKSEKAIREKATNLLVQILNDYSSFNISTIDSFFQKIVRSFARELNVPGNYEVELDSKSVIEASVSSFLDKLDSKQNRVLFDWLINFSEKRSENGESWDLRAKLLDMANKVLSSENYRKHSDKIKEFTCDRKRLSKYERMLSSIIHDWQKQLTDIGEKGLKLIEEYSIGKSELCYGGAGTISHFYAWAKGEEKDPTESSRFNDAIAEQSKLFKKDSPRYGTEVQNRLTELMKSGLELFTGDTYINYISASVIQQDFYELGIVANIDDELRDYCETHNIMMLNSTTELLSKLIQPYDAPFVYEKTGTHLKSYMIDEFQDTSGLQWHNFMPLVSNALSQGYQNLIVGDVKQSIYRWRGSDWGLLDTDIYHFEPKAHNDNDSELRTNWRSLPAIVEFNNKFFSYMASELDATAGTEQVKRIYKDVQQGLPKKKTKSGEPVGMVHIEHIIPCDQAGEPIAKPNKEDLLNEAKRMLPLQIIKLQEEGFAPRDIAILCRRKSECQLMAQTILQYKQQHPECTYPMDIISGEALQLGTRPVIQTLICMMQLLQNPKSELLQAVTWNNYLQLAGHSSKEALQIFFKMGKEQRAIMPQIAFRPIYELAEMLIRELPQDIIEQEAPFLQAFRDIVLEFSHSQNAGLSAFLEWWETTGHAKNITTPDALNAIQIMTIHQSKGLGMPAVIIPFASWEMDIDTSHDEIIWCKPDREPFAEDILLPIKLDKKLAKSIFCQDFAVERLRSIIDNLNTAYVAFTRPKEAMVIMTPVATGKSGSKLESLIDNYCQKLESSTELCVSGELHIPIAHQGDSCTIGTWQRASKKDATATNDSKDSSQLHNSAEITTQNQLPELSILHSPLQQDNAARRRGNCIHRVLQEIRHRDEYAVTIHRLYLKGIIDPNIISEGEMLQEIDRLLNMPEVAEWFADELKVLNEQTLMDKNGEQIRPDRIILDANGTATVIDYKTGGDHRGYRLQVKKYMNALKQLGFRSVKGFLFFLKDGRIVEVK